MKYSVIIPTLNAGKKLGCLINALLMQTLPPAEIVVVDSESDDDAIQQAKECDQVRVIKIKRTEFDHGGTRDMAIRACTTPVVVMMTQDALPEGVQCIEKLLEPLVEPNGAAVCARQVAYDNATAAEKAVREFRYPDTSCVWNKEEIKQKGIASYLLSDVCTAYRVSAYEAVGGFKNPIITNEDMLIAADFLDAGYKLAYQAEAVVRHSHHYTLKQEYRRNYLIGQFLAKYGDRFGTEGEMGEGIRLVKFVTQKLVTEHRVSEILPFWLNCASRLLGNRRGKRIGAQE